MSFTRNGHFVQGYSNFQYSDKCNSNTWASSTIYDDGFEPDTPIHEFYESEGAVVRERVRNHYNIPCEDNGYVMAYLKALHDNGLTDNINEVPLNDTANRIATASLI